MPYIVVKRSSVEQAIKNGGRVQVYIGPARGCGFLFEAGVDFREKFEVEGYAGAKKRLLVSISQAFPAARFGQEVIHTLQEQRTSIGQTADGRHADDAYVNFYLVFEKGERGAKNP